MGPSANLQVKAEGREKQKNEKDLRKSEKDFQKRF
jgi:hypothetical protein